MAYPIPNNPLVARVAMIFQRDTRRFVNTFHVARAAGWTLPLLGSLIVDAASWFDTWGKGALPSQLSLTEIQTRVYDPANPIGVSQTLSPTITGTRAGTPEVGSTTLSLSERTGRVGRAYRGRMYFPGFQEADISIDDKVASTIVAALAQYMSHFITGTFSNSVFPVVFHRPLPVPKPRDNTYDAVTNFVVENIIDSQRRRLPGRGR